MDNDGNPGSFVAERLARLGHGSFDGDRVRQSGRTGGGRLCGCDYRHRVGRARFSGDRQRHVDGNSRPNPGGGVVV